MPQAKLDRLLSCATGLGTGGRIDVIRFLLERGANPNGEDSRKIPLIGEIQLKRAEIVRLLLKYKADPNIEDLQGRTSLYVCAEYPSAGSDTALAEIIALLVRGGADLDKEATQEGSLTKITPIKVALQNSAAPRRLKILLQAQKQKTLRKFKIHSQPLLKIEPDAHS